MTTISSSTFLLAILPAPGWDAFLLNFGILGVVVIVLYLLFGILRRVFRQLTSDLPLVALNVSETPLILIAVAIGLRLALLKLSVTPTSYITWFQRGLTAFLILVVAFWVVQLIAEVLTYAFRQYSEGSEAMWDDVLAPILQNVLPLIVYLVGGLLFLQALGVDIQGLLVAIGGLSFILGFALKDILANFFSGLVLLIDTPFRFGDVIELANGKRGVIKHIGLRLTELYLIDTHSQIYIPNAAFEGQNIINLSRPTNHYYYTISIPIKADVAPALAISMIEKVVLAHPDTMGEIHQKLELIDQFYGYSIPGVKAQQKREAGLQRLLAESEVNTILAEIEMGLAHLADIISQLERGGLDIEERRTVQAYYLELCQKIGMESKKSDRHDRRRRSIGEATGTVSDSTLIGLIRRWYQYWLKDPDLFQEDQQMLKQEWEQKIDLLKIKVNKLFWAISNPKGLETRLDDLVEGFREWLRENFKSSRNEWQDPKIWINDLNGDYTRETLVRFYVDDIKLEHCERGQRILSEMRREIVWHLRQSYLSK
ncbi:MULTISPECIES: mechanosensitive ion channel family protein [unclassified Microcoleus]|uniref:mechanosensitive ion channel family protein n=1 Tax=unclassified Microcoleus TaxID=2642155 RepID=UPI00312BC696